MPHPAPGHHQARYRGNPLELTPKEFDLQLYLARNRGMVFNREVDRLYDRVFQELLKFMIEDPGNTTRATRLVWVAHNLERTADRVTNICERVVFCATGKMEEIGASKY